MKNFNTRENEFFNTLEKHGIQVPDEQKRRIQAKINSVLTYEPRIGIFGKSGNGKSSLCNALFGQDICPISDVAACTRNVKEVLVNMGGNGLKLIDVPGTGESSERDSEYAKLYSKLLPELDLVLWLLKADDRAYTSDQYFYNNIVKPHIDKGKPFLFVINQVDKIEPFREWDEDNHLPSIAQFSNIHQKIDIVSRYFNIASSKIIPVSAKEKYNLSKLIDEIVYALPREKKITFLNVVPDENRSANAVTAVRKAWHETLGEFLTTVVDTGREIILSVLDKPGDFIENLFGKLFSWF